MPQILGICAGALLPVQTCVNARLRMRLGSPYYASLVSFSVAWLLLLSLTMLTGQCFPFGLLKDTPTWMFSGGICGVVFLTGNILLLPKIGAVQTVVLPVLGQILTALVVDHFALFQSPRIPLAPPRAIGAVLAVAGVVTVASAKSDGKPDGPKEGGKKRGILAFQIFGVAAGMLTAVQTAVNGSLSKRLGSPVFASVVSFSVGIVLLVLVSAAVALGRRGKAEGKRAGGAWWIWTGGIIGALYMLTSVYLSRTAGTGMTLIVLLAGNTAGGIVIDQFALFGSAKSRMGARKAVGVLAVFLGSAVIRLM